LYGLQRYCENFLGDSRYVGGGFALLGILLVAARSGRVQASHRHHSTTIVIHVTLFMLLCFYSAFAQ
jgi:hypothetical protein